MISELFSNTIFFPQNRNSINTHLISEKLKMRWKALLLPTAKAHFQREHGAWDRRSTCVKSKCRRSRRAPTGLQFRVSGGLAWHFPPRLTPALGWPEARRPSFRTSPRAPADSSLGFRDARRVAVETPAGRGGARGGLSGSRCRSSRPAHARALRMRSLGPGPGSRWCARQDAEAQLGTPVTARAPAARGVPPAKGSVRETDPLSVGPPRRIRASAGGGVLHAAPWGLPPPIAGAPVAAGRPG